VLLGEQHAPERHRESRGTIFSLTGFSKCLWRRTSTTVRVAHCCVRCATSFVEFTAFERLRRTKLSKTRCAKRIESDGSDPALSLSHHDCPMMSDSSWIREGQTSPIASRRHLHGDWRKQI